MRNKVKLFFTGMIFMFVCVPFILGATPFTINAVYDFSNASSFIDGTVYKTDSIVLRIKTAIESECFYGESASPYIPFEGEYGLTHEIYLENIEEGFHEYYVRCGTSSNPLMKINFATSIPIYATVQLSGEPPLKEGKYKIDLVTSKTSLGTPTLEYSFDELVYKTIPLKGSGKNWEGNLIISGNAGESVCSFRFKARELSGEEGTKIVGDNLFIVDTIKPQTISIIDAVGYSGEIKITWFSEEEVEEFNIYRSEDSQVDYTDFYKSTSKDYFYDNDVEKGKTYYYRIAGVDEAGNIADLSREVYATALLSNHTQSSGLDAKLVGKVDNFITEVNVVLENVKDIDSLISLKGEKEETLFKEIKLDKELENSISELNSLKRDVESYKLQDLSENELNNKISSASLRLSIIKKKIPEELTIIEEKEIGRVLNEENVQRAFLEYSLGVDYDYKKEITATLKRIEDKKIKIDGEFYKIELMYLDGTKKIITLIKESISSETDYGEDLYSIIIMPKEIAERASELKIMNLEYEVIKEDPVILFKPSTKEIVYYINKEINLDSLEDVLISPIIPPSEETGESNITGSSILELGSKGSFGIVALILFALILGIYFFKIKRDSSIKPLLITIEDIKKVKELIKQNKGEEAKELYNRIKEVYKTLSDKEKRLVTESIKQMNEEISK